MGILNKRDFITCIVLFVVTFFSRIYLVEQYQSHWDGPQYSIAVFDYSLQNQTPAPPGYPLYIGIATILNVLIDNPHYSLIFESVFFSAIGAIFIFIFGQNLGKGYKTGIIAACIYFSSPVVYFFGLTAYAYGVSAVFYLFFAYRVYLLTIQKDENPYLLGLSYALLLGIRPQDFIYSWPLFLFAIIVATKKNRLKILVIFAISCLIWFVPQVIIVGGIEKFVSIVSPIGNEKIPTPSFLHAIDAIGKMSKGVILTLGSSILIIIIYPFRKFILGKVPAKFFNRKQWLVFILWSLPPLLFNLFVRTDHAGYQLTYLIPLILLLSKILSDSVKSVNLLKLFVVLIMLSNLLLFFKDRDSGLRKPYVPTSFHYSEIRKNDLAMSEKVNYIMQNYSPMTTLILIGEPDYYRPVMYHLHNYLVVQADRLVVEDERFKRIIRTAKNYKSKEVSSESNFYMVPANITDIVCFDDNCFDWISAEKDFVKFRGGSIASVLLQGRTIVLGLHRIDIH